MSDQDQVNPETGEIQQQKADQLAPAAAALQAQQVAMVQARVALAFQRPRDPELFRQKLLKECKRPGFADAAIYSKPVGGSKIEGPSIRFAEAVLRLMGNLLIESQVVMEDDEKRVVRVMAMDLETNATDYQDAVIAKIVERKSPGDRPPLSVRRNSRGEPTYVLRATEDEMLTKTNAAVSKMRRNKILALAPADIIEEAQQACEATLRDRDAKDPDTARRQLLDAFAGLGVLPPDLKEFLGHDTERLQPAELKDLRTIFQGLKQGETTWRDVMDQRRPATPAAAPAKDTTGTKAERLAKDLNAKPNREPGE